MTDVKKKVISNAPIFIKDQVTLKTENSENSRE
jgi:hypothetical protein